MGEDRAVGADVIESLPAWRLAVAAVALAVVVAAVCYRQLRRRRTRAHFRRLLEDPAPDERAAAARAWCQFGLHRSAPDLVTLVRWEENGSVLEAVADAVRARAWEPTSSRATSELREWCAAYRSWHDDAHVD